jgi:hypothetical protein
LAQLQTPDAKLHVPGARKFGLGAMLADGFEIERGGAFVTGGLFTVVVVVGATVVGVTTVVGVGIVVVGLGEPFDVDRDFGVPDVATARA